MNCTDTPSPSQLSSNVRQLDAAAHTTGRAPVWLAALIALVVGMSACHLRDSGRIDTASLQRDAAGPLLRVTILGDPSDPRIPFVREALGYWNRELLRVGRHVHFDSATVRDGSVPDALLRAASGEAVAGSGPALTRLRAMLGGVNSEVVVALSRTDLVSFSVPWEPARRGIVGIRRSDILPLSLPNTVRNVVAHELGHVLGLEHNMDASTLMCGRPARCRPAAFTSARPRFFPLTSADDRWLQDRWP